MAETAIETKKRVPHHKELIGIVISNKMQKTIVVEVTRKKQHAMYARVISIRKKFYAHDENNETHPGDVVKIEETRPLSKLKRWKLKEVVRKTALVPDVDVEAGTRLTANANPEQSAKGEQPAKGEKPAKSKKSAKSDTSAKSDK